MNIYNYVKVFGTILEDVKEAYVDRQVPIRYMLFKMYLFSLHICIRSLC